MRTRGRVARRLGDAAVAFGSNARNANLRRAQLGFLGAWMAECAFTVALGIFAYRDGGVVAVGVVGLLRMLPSAVFAPLLTPVADRGRRERVLVLVCVLRALVTSAAAAVAAMAGPAGVVYALAALSTIAATLFRPVHSALLPSLCSTGQELASANMVRGLLDSAATLIGPLLAALLLTFVGVDVVFAVAAAASFWAAALLWRVRYETPARPSADSRPQLVREAVEGLRTVAHDRGLSLILGLAAAQAISRGALNVLSVVLAIDVLRTGESGVATLMSAVGVGAVLGSLAASLLVGTKRLGSWFAVGVAAWGLPLALIGAVPDATLALLLLACLGVGNALIDVSGFTLLARIAPNDVLARVFGVLESLVAMFVGLGGIVASVLVERSGPRTALVCIGLVCPVLSVLSWRRLRALDQSVGVRDLDVDLLRRVPMLRTLPLPAIEQLARGLEPTVVPAGEAVFRQGDVGDRYFVIESGEAAVLGDGRVVTTLGPGDGFGEIALLRPTPRTATVMAATALRLQALHSERFLPVVSGYAPSYREAGSAIDLMLDRFTPGRPANQPPATP